MARIKQHGRQSDIYGEIYFLSVDGKEYCSTPLDHLMVLESQPFGPQIVREQASHDCIVSKIVETLGERNIQKENVLIRFDWNTGKALQIRV